MRALAKRNDRRGQRKLIGVKISTRVLRELKGYAEYADQPMNRCVDELLDQAISQDGEYQSLVRRKSHQGVSQKQGWDAFLALGRDASVGRVTDASSAHDRYLYGKATR